MTQPRRNRYQTQWAAQFYVAAELARRGYLVSFTLGNAPVVDLLVVSSQGTHFQVDVKGQATRSFWLVRKREPQDDLFYVLVYLPKGDKPPRFFILGSLELMNERDAYRRHIEATSGRYRDDLGGLNWSTAFSYENKWDTLPP